MKNLKFEKSLDPKFAAKQFEDLKDYIEKRNVCPVVVGYHKKDEEFVLSDEDLESFATELGGYYLYSDNPSSSIREIT